MTKGGAYDFKNFNLTSTEDFWTAFMQNLTIVKSHPSKIVTPKNRSMMSYLNLLLSVKVSSEGYSALKQNISNAILDADVHATAKALLAMGRFYLLDSDYQTSIEYYVKSLDGFKKHKDINGIIITTTELSHIYNFLSDFVQVGRLNMQLHEMMFQTNDPIAKAYIRLNLAEHAILNMSDHALVMGKMSDMEADIMKICDLCHQLKCWYLYAIAAMVLGYLRLEKGQCSRAITLFNSTRQIIEDYDLPDRFTYYIYHLLPEAYWLEYKQNENHLTPIQKKAYLKQIGQLCETALKKTKQCPYHYGNALRVQAKYFLLAGRYQESENLFLQSIRHGSKFSRKFELGISIFHYAYLLKLIGRQADAVERLHQARSIFKTIGASIYLRRIARILNDDEDEITSEVIYDKTKTITDIIDFCRQLNPIQELNALLDQVLDYALALSDADRGCLFIKDEKGRMELAAAKAFNTSAAKREIGLSRSISAFNHPFKLYIPITFGNREIGFCYLDTLKSAKKFNGHITGSIYLFISQAAPLIENCRLNQLIKYQKETHSVTISPSTEKKLGLAADYIKLNYHSTISRKKLADMLHMNADNLGRFFKQYTGYKISEFTNRLRMEDAICKLTESDEKIIDIAFSVGFESLTTFNRVFSALLNTTPSKYRKSHQKQHIDSQMSSG